MSDLIDEKERKMIMSIALRFGAVSRPVHSYDCEMIFDEKQAVRPEALQELQRDIAARRDVSFELPSDTHEHWLACNEALRELVGTLKKDVDVPLSKISHFRPVTFGKKS